MTGSEALSRLHTALNQHLLTVADTEITVFTLVSLALVFLLATQGSRILQRTIARAAKVRELADDGSVFVVQRLAHYTILMVGGFIALQAIGIDLGALLAAGAVFAVGVGLALQHLAQNIVSGIILLVERVIKPGDVVEVDGRVVQIMRLGMRSTLGRTRDGEDLVIPNSHLVQGTVKNLTHDDPLIRVRVSVGVAYTSDMGKVGRVLVEAASQIPWRAPGTEPTLLWREFGNSSVVWEISVWGSDPWRLPIMRTDLARATWDTLAANQITIAYPQLDLHLDPPVVEVLGRAAR